MIPEPWLEPYIPEEGPFAVDVGYGEGWWTEEFATRFDFVYSFDPDYRSWNRRTLPKNAYLFPVALSHSPGMVALSLYQNPLLSHLPGEEIGEIAERGEVMEERLVPMMPLDDFHLLGADLIKIDVEGAEVNVLRGAECTLADNDVLLIVEVHTQENGEEIPKLLPDYYFWRVDDPAVPKEIQQRYFWLIGQKK